MSDLSVTLEALERSRSQLSVSTYFDADVFRRENEQIFQNGPRYLGHELAVPEVGDYRTLIQEGEGRALVRTSRGRGTHLQCLPASSGGDAARQRQHAEHGSATALLRSGAGRASFC